MECILEDRLFSRYYLQRCPRKTTGSINYKVISYKVNIMCEIKQFMNSFK